VENMLLFSSEVRLRRKTTPLVSPNVLQLAFCQNT
jgi:hypothetical protein